MPELNARFRDHTLRLFANHGMDVVGFWTYGHGGWSDQLVYMMKFDDMERPRPASGPRSGPTRSGGASYAESHREGSLTTRIRSDILTPTDYSPLP